MKKEFVFAALVCVILFSGLGWSAPLTVCQPRVEIFNQDPYPANPGEYVRVVFQITGLENPDCKQVTFDLEENFPFTLDPGETSEVDVMGGAYVRNFNSTALIPYKIRVDEDAVDGNNEIEGILRFETSNGAVFSQIENFNINVEGVKVDFEVSIKDFDYGTNFLTFEILNIGEDDVEALVVEIPKQDAIVVKGSSRNIIGGLDANEDTTFKYEAWPYDGEIELAVSYTDSIHERRHLMKKVYFDSSYFTGRKADAVQPQSTYYYLFWGLLLILVLLFVRNWWKKRKKRERERTSKK